jgi:NAD(P)-dependent dehydrogenase (short-subunit alcohol dehydrogenase family)
MNADRLRSLFDLSGRTAIITGGTRGIGSALAQGYLAAGANVVVTGRSEERCRAAQDKLDVPGRVAAVAAHIAGRVHLRGNYATVRSGQRRVDAFGGSGFRAERHPRQRARPGPVDTQMMRNNPPEFIEATANETLLRRLADPDEMVGPALLLTSDAGSYITG